MLTKVHGIVLYHIKFKESSAIAHIYTDLYGRQSFLFNNVRGRKGSQHSNILQPLFLLEMETYYKSQRELHRVKEFSQFSPFRTIPYDLYKSSQAMFVAEILYRSLQEQEPNPVLFNFLVHSIQWLDTAEKHFSSFHLLFLAQLTKHLGFFPENNYSSTSIYFDMRNGQFTGSDRIHPDIMDKETSKAFHHILQKSFSDLPRLRIKHSMKSQLIDSLLNYYRLHIHGFGIVRSIAVLQEVFK